MIENRNFEPSCDVCDFSRQRTIRGTRLQISTRVIMGEHDRARADFESTGNDDPGKRLAISDRARREALATDQFVAGVEEEHVKVLVNLVRQFEPQMSDQVRPIGEDRSEEHTSELQSLMRISYAVFCLKKKQQQNQ